MYQWIAFGITAIILLLLAIRKPLWLVTLFVVAVALEISKTWYPDLGLVGDLFGEISLATFTGIALILAVFFRFLFVEEMRRKLSAVFSDSLTVFLLIYLVTGAVSLVYSVDAEKTIFEFLTLLALFAVFIAIALLIDKDHALLPFQALHSTALVLAVLSFYEAFTGNLLWQSPESSGDFLIAKATFTGSDIFARYVILAIIANFIIQLYNRDRSRSLLYTAALAVLVAQLALTASSGGIVTLLVVLIAALILLPNRKAPLWVLGLGTLGGSLVLLARPDLWESMQEFIRDFGISNPQIFNQDAIALFKENLIIGTGLGTFTGSDNSVLTIAAEQGIIGLTALTLIWIVLVARLLSLYSIGGRHISMFDNYRNEYYVGAGYFLLVLTIFVNSLLEGRFFADPILWLSFACLVILKFHREYDIGLD